MEQTHAKERTYCLMLSIPFMSSIIGWFSTDVPEDPVMKLVTRITAAILLFCGTITGGTLYFGDSFECMLPLTHSPEWGDFAKSSCFWTPELFYEPSGEPFSAMEVANRRSHIIGYYPYTSMYLLVSSFLCLLPRILWKWMLKRCGVPLKIILSETKNVSDENWYVREEVVVELEELLDDKLEAVQTQSMWGIWKPNLLLRFSVVKSFTGLLICAQFAVLVWTFNHNLEVDWGWEVMWYSFFARTKPSFDMDSFFPRHVFCEYEFNKLDGMYREETLECLLTFNPFFKMCFVFIWFWCIFVALVIIIDVVYFSVYSGNSKKDVEDELLNSATVRLLVKGNIMDIKCYVYTHLTMDQVLVYRFIKRKCGATAHEVMMHGFVRWNNQRRRGNAVCSEIKTVV